MRFLFVSLVVLISGVLSSCKDNNLENEIGQKTTIKITKIFDAGESVKGEKIYASFEVENTGR